MPVTLGTLELDHAHTTRVPGDIFAPARSANIAGNAATPREPNTNSQDRIS
jgi:hypothetical protein